MVDEDFIKCKICGKKYKGLARHIKTHDITILEYKEKYGKEIVSKSYSKKLSDNLKNTHKKWKDFDPDSYYNHQSIAGKKGWETLKEWKEDNKELMIELVTKNLKYADIANKKIKKEDPERYYKHRRENGKQLYQWCLDNHGGKRGVSEYCSNLAKETHKKHPELAHRLGMITQRKHPNIIEYAHKWWRDNPEKASQKMKETLPKIMVSNLKNKPYWFMGIPFDSNDEVEVVKYLNRKINYIPEYGVNYQFQVDTKFVDFYLSEYNLFIEYHPVDWRGLSDEEYRQERLTAINKTDHDEQLWVIKKVNDLDNMLW